jgi:acetaldehyde dehydrogenase (acetylating)
VIVNVAASKGGPGTAAARDELARHTQRLVSIVTWMEVLAGSRNAAEEEVIERSEPGIRMPY